MSFPGSCSWLLLFLSLAAVDIMAGSTKSTEKIYIVYMGSVSDKISTTSHVDMLQDVKAGRNAAGSLLHSYKRSFNGFVAKLTPQEAKLLAGNESVISVFENKINKLHTTRSWDFLGLAPNAKRNIQESNVTIGVIDTGIWPEAPSFRDDHLGPPPSHWNGVCQSGIGNFSCNNKVIGARFYHLSANFSSTDLLSPRDSSGHGTHTSSTVAGAYVETASFFGLGAGTARGGVPSARVAIYKVCWEKTDCEDADVLAAFDDAIADGVQIISISIGSDQSIPYFKDPIAIGSLHAHRKGVLTCSGAGNDGPGIGKVSNNAPWLVSVAASTDDRKFLTMVKLGSNESIEGVSANTFDNKDHMSDLAQMLCPPSDAEIVRNKIIFCASVRAEYDQIAETLHRKGAAGVLFASSIPAQAQINVHTFSIPAAVLTVDAGVRVFNYIKSASHPTAAIAKTTQTLDATAPRVAGFSSRGPSPNDLFILKPDLAAPGVNILAGWSLAAPITSDEEDNRRVMLMIESGTSMACPHVSAAAALVKSFYPTWTPSAVMSALLTTATPMNPKENSGGIFAYGAGNVNPIAATDPGLLYHASTDDFIELLCSEGYNSGLLQLITGDASTCKTEKNRAVWDLNYPSFTVYMEKPGPISTRFSRLLTNVGTMGIYRAKVETPDGFTIRIEPPVLEFHHVGEEKAFQMFVDGNLTGNLTSGSLIWSDGIHQVRSPIILHSLT